MLVSIVLAMSTAITLVAVSAATVFVALYIVAVAASITGWYKTLKNRNFKVAA